MAIDIAARNSSELSFLWAQRSLHKAFRAICNGEPSGGPIAALPKPERFHWLVAPRSTMIQTSPVHVGRSQDAERALEDLLQEFVRPPHPAAERAQAAGANGA